MGSKKIEMLCKVTDERIAIYDIPNILTTTIVIQDMNGKKHVFWRLRDAGEYLQVGEDLMEDICENRIPFPGYRSGRIQSGIFGISQEKIR